MNFKTNPMIYVWWSIFCVCVCACVCMCVCVCVCVCVRARCSFLYVFGFFVCFWKKIVSYHCCYSDWQKALLKHSTCMFFWCFWLIDCHQFSIWEVVRDGSMFSFRIGCCSGQGRRTKSHASTTMLSWASRSRTTVLSMPSLRSCCGLAETS